MIMLFMATIFASGLFAQTDKINITLASVKVYNTGENSATVNVFLKDGNGFGKRKYNRSRFQSNHRKRI